MPGSLVRSPGQTDMGDRSGAASLVQKQIEQIEHSDDDRDRGSMVLVDSFIGDEGATVVADALRKNYTVKSLDMRGCNVRSDGAVALAELIENNVHLQSLGLEWNSIGMVESGLERICKALTRNSTITELDLRNNGISPTGGTALGEMLSINTSLKRIDLRWNNLGSSGGKAILEGLLRNRSMIDVMLAGNKVSDETLRQVDQCLHKNRGQVVENIAERSYVAESTRKKVGEYNHDNSMMDERSFRQNFSPAKGRHNSSSPGLSRRSPPSTMQADALSPEKRSIFPHESDVSRLFKQASHLRNSVSGEVLEQNFREKLADLSRALVSEKEANISLERRYCDEVEYRASLEGKLLEYERLLRSAEESLLLEKSQAEMREAELLSNLEKEKGYRQASEQQVISTKVEFSELNKAHQDHVRESSRRIQDLTNEVTRCTTEISLSKKETEEHKRGADQRQQRLIEDLRQTEDQRSHLDKLYQSSVAKVADVEALLEKTRSDLTLQIKILSDKLEREFADRTEAEETHVREIRALNDRIRSLGDSLQAEQEVLSKTKDDLLSASQARDRLQTRLNHLTDESMEMRKEMSAKRAEYENKLGLENDARERVEAQLADKCAQYEQLQSELVQARHKIGNLNGSIERLEQQAKNRVQAHEEKTKELMQETSDVREQFDKYKDNMERRIAGFEKQLMQKDQDIMKIREEEAYRIVTLEDRLMQTMRSEIAKASPSLLKTQASQASQLSPSSLASSIKPFSLGAGV